MSGKVPKQNLPACRIYSGICQVLLLPKKHLLPRPVLETVWLTCEGARPKGIPAQGREGAIPGEIAKQVREGPNDD